MNYEKILKQQCCK